MGIFASFLAGLVFGLGLLISGMASPTKVLGFLDLAGSWDPSLALVMVGAIAVGLVAFTVARRRTVSFLGLDMKLPTARHIDRRLVVGSLLFGVGWGIAGLCPGPALVALGAGQSKSVVFVAAMLAGMGVFELLERRRPGRPERWREAKMALTLTWLAALAIVTLLLGYEGWRALVQRRRPLDKRTRCMQASGRSGFLRYLSRTGWKSWRFRRCATR
jgi:uncharacterized membrane protein YedE/YeeE